MARNTKGKVRLFNTLKKKCESLINYKMIMHDKKLVRVMDMKVKPLVYHTK